HGGARHAKHRRGDHDRHHVRASRDRGEGQVRGDRRRGPWRGRHVRQDAHRRQEERLGENHENTKGTKTVATSAAGRLYSWPLSFSCLSWFRAFVITLSAVTPWPTPNRPWSA